MEDLAAFTNDLHGYLMSEGRVKPRISGPAPKADAGRPAATGAPAQPARTAAPTADRV